MGRRKLEGKQRPSGVSIAPLKEVGKRIEDMAVAVARLEFLA